MREKEIFREFGESERSRIQQNLLRQVEPILDLTTLSNDVNLLQYAIECLRKLLVLPSAKTLDFTQPSAPVDTVVTSSTRVLASSSSAEPTVLRPDSLCTLLAFALLHVEALNPKSVSGEGKTAEPPSQRCWKRFAALSAETGVPAKVPSVVLANSTPQSGLDASTSSTTAFSPGHEPITRREGRINLATTRWLRGSLDEDMTIRATNLKIVDAVFIRLSKIDAFLNRPSSNTSMSRPSAWTARPPSLDGGREPGDPMVPVSNYSPVNMLFSLNTESPTPRLLDAFEPPGEQQPGEEPQPTGNLLRASSVYSEIDYGDDKPWCHTSEQLFIYVQAGGDWRLSQKINLSELAQIIAHYGSGWTIYGTELRAMTVDQCLSQHQPAIFLVDHRERGRTLNESMLRKATQIAGRIESGGTRAEEPRVW